MEWLDQLEDHAYNFVIDELVWHLREGRQPKAIAKVLNPSSGIEFFFDNAPMAFFPIDPEFIEESWIEALEIISQFQELKTVRAVAST